MGPICYQLYRFSLIFSFPKVPHSPKHNVFPQDRTLSQSNFRYYQKLVVLIEILKQELCWENHKLYSH